MASGIKNVIFDFGNVLYGVDTNAHIEFLRSLGKKPVHTMESAELKELIKNFESGVIPESLFFAAWEKLEFSNFSHGDLTKAWAQILLEPYYDQEEPIRELKANYQLALLSNTNSAHLKLFEKPAFPLLRHFKKRFYSFEIGYTKPQLHAFAYVLKTCDFEPAETAFIDDRPENIEAAEELGITGIFLQNPDLLANELKAHGLIS